MATWLRSSFNDILGSVVARLAEVTSFPSERIKITAKRQWARYQNDQVLFVIPQGITRTAAVADGSGRIMTQVERQVWVQCAVRLALDTVDSGEYWFTDETLGLIALEEMVLDALTEWKPVDTSQNALTIEPVKFLGAVPPTQEVEMPGYGQETLAFNIIYGLPLTQSYQ